MSIMSTIAEEHYQETKELRAEIKRHRREYQRLIERCNKAVELGIHIQGELDIVEAENTRLREMLGGLLSSDALSCIDDTDYAECPICQRGEWHRVGHIKHKDSCELYIAEAGLNPKKKGKK